MFTGVFVNTAAIVAGGAVGLIIKGGLPEKYKSIIMQGLAICTMFIGFQTALPNLAAEGANPLLFIISFVIGSLIGTWVDIDKRLQNLGDSLQEKIGGSNVSQGFVSASLVFCVGSMAILGSIDSGIRGDHSLFYVKSLIDGTSAIIFASTLGVGVVLSAASVFIYQGVLTLLAGVIQPYLTGDMLREMSIIGGIFLFVIGLNLLEIKKIKVANMLPALLVPVVYYLPFFQRLVGIITGIF